MAPRIFGPVYGPEEDSTYLLPVVHELFKIHFVTYHPSLCNCASNVHQSLSSQGIGTVLVLKASTFVYFYAQNALYTTY